MPANFTLKLLLSSLLLLKIISVRSQSGTDFWFAPPDITDLHNSPGGEPLYLLASSLGQAATVTISQPANPSFNGGNPIVVTLAANASQRVDLTSLKSALETRPTNTILNTGLRIQSTTPITCYYECANTNNTDIWALKGANSFGTEFYIPLHKHAPFYNHGFASPHLAFASFDICATQNNTIVTIYSPTPVDGHAALQQFSVTLNQGQTYSCGWTGSGYDQPSNHPSGAIVLSDKPITVSLKDDSNHNPSGGCYDILGDQIVPSDVVGLDYIAVKGSLNNNGDESVVLMATQNNTRIYIDGSSTPAATLFAGEYYRVDMDYLSGASNNAVYISCTKPTYALHITGFGCEMGMAQLPPLNCAGSQSVNFVRSSSETFYLTLLCRTAAVNGFTISGSGTATIDPASFVQVPGTGGEWSAARITYNTTQIPVDQTFRVTNSIDVFALGLGNGGSSSGCRYGYFSEFVAPITADAGSDQTICANTTAQLSGSVSGGTTTGTWSSSGTGSFTPGNTVLNAVYTPSAADAAAGSVVLTLTSTGACTPVSDQTTLTISPAPTVNAGPDQTLCRNNANVSLDGSVTVATGGVWTGGAGTFIPGNTTLNAVYLPTSGELASGSLVLTLTTTGNGICNPASDNVLITFTPSPVANAGADITRCGNNAAATLNGSVTVATGGVWTGGGGSFSPSASTLNAVYTPSADEILAGSVTLTLTSTGNNNCNAVSDQVTIFYTTPPTANAGVDQTKCANNATTTLSGSVSIASGGQWSGGLGTFSPGSSALNATYSPTAAEIAAGSVTLTLTTTGNGSCSAVTDQMTIFFTPAPTAGAGPDLIVCANNPMALLNGSVTIASGGIWGGGAGTFAPNNTTLNTIYTPSDAEIEAGSVTLTLSTTGNGLCSQVSDQVTITITPAPTVDAGTDRTACANNATITLSGQISHAAGGTWTGGAGTFSPNANALNATYTPTAGEIDNGSVTLTLTSAGNGLCNAVSDQMVITYTAAPVVNAGSDQTKCANNAVTSLAGSVMIASGGQWSGGLGLFSPGNNTLNATYTPTAAEIASGQITLTLTSTGNNLCSAVTDQMTIFFTAAPTASAGTDILVCANNATAQLNGSVTIASGGIWSGGNGTFSPSTAALNATYTPTATEIAIGSVTLTLTTTGNGLCNEVSDQVTITIAPAPIVNAGLNINACANNSTVTLNGQVFNAGGGIWSGGNGTFFPNNSVLNATYTPSAEEVDAGSVVLTLTSSGNGTCNAVSDDVTISFAPAPVANAGVDQTVCGNNALVNLNGFINYAAGGQWSGGLGVFSPSANALNASYSPSATEIANGFVDLTLTSTGNGSCIAVTDVVRINYTPAPTVSAGSALVSCENSPSVQLNGSFSVATGAIWSDGEGIFSPSAGIMDATYTPSAEEIEAGSLTLTLTTTGNGLCLPETSSVQITIIDAPAVNAGEDQTICVSNLNVQLSGSISGPTNSGIWTTSGSGIFMPNATALNAIYECSEADSLAGGITLTLTSTNNASCNAVSDNMQILILPAGLSNAGADQIVCGNNATIQLNGSIGGGATSGTWGTTGSGTFSPDNQTLGATYTPSATDIASGEVRIYLTANSCNLAVDTLVLSITPARQLSAGPDQTICADQSSIQLDGQITGGLPTGIWTTSGSGTFTPDNTTLNATYTPSAADINAQVITLTLTSTNNGSCAPLTDQMTLNIFNVGGANAGADQTVCGNNAGVQLNGTLSGAATTGVWTSSGTGLFSPSSTAADATYQPSEQDVLNGNVLLTWSATNSCNEATDDLTISFTPAPMLYAGEDQFRCGDQPVFEVSAEITNAGGIQWSGGNGIFTPNDHSVNITYTPSETEETLGSVTLIATTTGIGNCLPVSDAIVLHMSSGIAVNAGQDQSVCISAELTQLQGVVANGSSTGIWTTTGSGTFTPDASALNALYTFSEADKASGFVTFTLTSTNTGDCPVVSDEITVTFSSGVFVQTGENFGICASQNEINISGIVSGGATLGTWTTNGSGQIGDVNILNTTYVLSETDRLLGQLRFYLVSTNNGSCEPGYDTLYVNITPVSSVTAGSDIPICSTQTEVALSGNISGASESGMWMTLGNGNFTGGTTYGQTSGYSPSASDIQNGFADLVLTSSNTGLCSTSSDTVRILIDVPAGVNAGADQTICSIQPSVSLIGLIQSETSSGIWTSSGTGSFTSEASVLSNTYNISASDISTGTITLTLTSSDNGACPAIQDELVITVVPATQINAGPDRIICADQDIVDISGIILGSTGTGIWTTTGTGDFILGADELSNTYLLSTSDIAVGNITLTLTSTNNQQCPQVTDELTIIVESIPVAAFSSESDDNLSVSFTDESVGANQWAWSFENGATSASQNPSVTFPSAGQYEVMLVVSNTAGCRDTITSVVQAFDQRVEPIAVPTGFSPNSDGNNEVLHVLGGPFETVEFKIYNGWGNLIFSTTDPKAGWDGTYKGVAQPVGVYVYTVEGITIEGKALKMSGNVTLIR